MSQDSRPSLPYAFYAGSSSGGASGIRSVALVRTDKEDEVPCTRKPIDMISAVKEFHALSKEDLSKLIKDGKNGNIQWTKADGTSFEINVKDMARNLSIHLVGYYLESELDDELYRYLLAGVRLLHTLCDLKSRHRRLQKVLFDETESSRQKAYLHWNIILVIQKIDASSDMVHLHSALLASTLYLFKSIMLDWNAHWLDGRLSEGDVIACLAFQAVDSVIKFLQVKLSCMQSSDDEVYHLFQSFEASLQFLYTLSQDEVFRKRALKNLVLSVGNVVLKLVHDIMKLPECEDSYLTACFYRLKTEALYIMLNLCEAPNSSFLKLSISPTRGLNLAKSTLSEVLEVLKKMFRGEFKDHPRGTLQLNALRMAEIFAADNNLKSFIVLNFTESLTRVFSQSRQEFLCNWCSSELDPIEEDVHLDFDSVAAAGEILGVIPRLDVSKSTYSTSRARQTPYAHHKSSLLVKILAHLTCSTPDMHPGEKGLLSNKFFQCLEMEHPDLPNGSARIQLKRADVAMKNLRSLLAHAGSLVPEYIHQEDVNIFRMFIKELEALLGLPWVKVHRLIFWENADNHSEGVVTEDQTENQCNGVTKPQQDVSVSGMQIAVMDPQEETVRSMQGGENKKKKTQPGIMNDTQEALIKNAFKDELDIRLTVVTRKLWADKLSAHGDQITPKQLSNWVYYRNKKAREAAKDGALLQPPM